MAKSFDDINSFDGINPCFYYQPKDPVMRLFGSVGKLAVWRNRGQGPAFYKIGRNIRYHGRDLIEFLQASRVDNEQRD